MDAILPTNPPDPNGSELATSSRSSIPSAYSKRMSKTKQAAIKASLGEDDQYALHTEMAAYREGLGTLFALEAATEKKHPDRPDLMLAIQSQQAAYIDAMVRTMKVAREVENSGDVFTTDRVSALIDKIASIIVYRTEEGRLRETILADLSDIASLFRSSSAEGTLVTPDRDASMMDDSVPGMSDGVHNSCGEILEHQPVEPRTDFTPPPEPEVEPADINLEADIDSLPDIEGIPLKTYKERDRL